MKPITVAMVTDSKGIAIEEAFTMVHQDLETAQTMSKTLQSVFKAKSFDQAGWGKARKKIAEKAIADGNKLVFKTYLF
jgi:nucleoid-associated protein YejK